LPTEKIFTRKFFRLTGKGLNYIHGGHFDKIECYCRKDYARRK